MRPSLRRILERVSSPEPRTDWTLRIERIRWEREEVEKLLEQGSSGRVYGFNTLLGHLDAQEASSADFGQLLDAHTVGPTSSCTRAFFTLVALCKIEQLHHGGTGIHPDTYLELVGSIDRLRGDCQASTASYGSGDVVPAAWWVRDLVANRVFSGEHAGDLICLINGSFYSTAYAIDVSLELCEILADFLVRYSAVAVLPAISATLWSLPAELTELFSQPSQALASQLPVSLRDAGPVLAAIISAIDQLGSSIEDRLSRPSGNPLFDFSSDRVTVQSQSSFLDFTMTFALTNAIQVSHLVIGLTQRLLAHIDLGSDDTVALVQPPKVAQAMVEFAQLHAGQLPMRFTGGDSLGVEDVRDLALASGQSLRELLGIAREQLDLLDEAQFAMANDYRRSKGGVADSLRRLLVDGRLS